MPVTVVAYRLARTEPGDTTFKEGMWPAVLRTEADIVNSLARAVITLDEVYRLCKEGADISRDRGHEPPSPRHMTDERWKHRARSAIAHHVKKGTWQRRGPATWLAQGTRAEPCVMVLITAGRMHDRFELHLRDAVRLLTELVSPADLICCDPPYALGWDTRSSPEQQYARDRAKVIGGYVDVSPARYAEWTAEWMQAAAGALRPGAQLAVVTGPQQAARVQVAAEQVGLVWVTSIAAFRQFALRTLSRPAASHWTITVMCRGPLDHSGRVFNVASDLPRSASGGPYPLDWWPDNGRADRPGLMRYANGLPLRLVQRIVTSFSAACDHVVDPFLGGGTTAIAAWLLGRRFTGGDVNPRALRFTAARLMEEHIRPSERQPALFERPRG